MKLLVGKYEAPEPAIRFWLEPYGCGIGLCAKADGDAIDQRILFVEPDKDGDLVVRFPGLHADTLLAAFGIRKGHTPWTVGASMKT